MQIYAIAQFYKSDDSSCDDEFLGFADAYTDLERAEALTELWNSLEENKDYVFRIEPLKLIEV